jgi:Tol biopolymer transport system component
MNTRKTLIASVTALIVTVVLIVGALSFTLDGAWAQLDPTSEKQTIDAVVADRFTQTAAVQQQLAMTQQADAGPTLTAAFDATVNAAFNQALTATAYPFLALEAALPGLERLNALNVGRIEAVGALPAAVQNVTSLAFSPDGQAVAVIIGQNTLAVVQIATGTFLSTQQGYGDLTAVAFNPDGKSVAFSGLSGDVNILDLTSQQVTLATAGMVPSGTGEAAVLVTNDLAFSPDGSRLAIGTSGPLMMVWDTTGSVLTFDTGSQGVDAVAFSPDGTLIASGANDGTVALWDAASLAPVRTLVGHAGTITSLAFSPDGSQIASGSADGSARLWNPATGDSLATLTTGNSATAVAFSPDGSLLAVGVSDRAEEQTILFDAALGGDHAKLAALTGSAGGIFALAFSPDGALLATGGDTVQLWGVRAAEVVAATAVPQTPLPPSLAASATPRPDIFPTNVAVPLDIAEETFQHGRMFWLRPNRQIWVMVNNPSDNVSGGEWYCYNDSFVEGEAETDPSLVPPADLYQPRRGFGKVWRNVSGLRDSLGWATTPEFELASAYTYIAGGYVENGAYVAGPGEHRLTTLYGDTISFFEVEIRGDCLGGTWRMTQ